MKVSAKREWLTESDFFIVEKRLQHGQNRRCRKVEYREIFSPIDWNWCCCRGNRPCRAATSQISKAYVFSQDFDSLIVSFFWYEPSFWGKCQYFKKSVA